MPAFVAGRWEDDPCIGSHVMQKASLQAMMEIDQ